MNHTREVDYILGHNEAELQRLIRQSAFYAELTEDVLRSAGVSEGMRVLDVGCGAGDISLMAARLVGPSGAVLGVDKSSDALALARRRADAEHVHHASFIEGDLAELDLLESFDALIGRFVLMYFADPSAALQKMTRHIRAGGVIAFQEIDMSAAHSVPAMPLYEKCGDWIRATFERANVDTKMGLGLYATFRQAGLPGPQLTLAARIGGGPESPLPDYITDVVVSLLPMMEKFGVATAAEVRIETLAARLREEANNCNGVMISPSLVGAWTRKLV